MTTSAPFTRRSRTLALTALTALLAAAGPVGTALAAPAAVPGQPRSVAASAGNATATVTWQAPTSNGGSPITGYTARCASTGTPSGATGTASVGGSALAATVTGLTNGATYTCTVTAANASGAGAASAASASFVPYGPPTAPRAVGASTKAGTLTVKWLAPTSTGGQPLTGYAVTCTSTDGGAALSGTTGASTLTLALTGLPDNRTYSCKVTATGPGGTSPAGKSAYVLHAKLAVGAETVTGHVPVTAAQSVSAVVTATSLPSDCSVETQTVGPDGTPLGLACNAAGAFVDGARVSGAGTATVVVTGGASAAGTCEIVTYVFTDVSGTATVGGPAVTAATTSPGQNARYTFTGTAGQGVTATITGNTYAGVYVEITRADGSVLDQTYLTSATGFVDTVTLPSSGTYAMVVDPAQKVTGKVTVALGNVPANTGTLTVGTPTTLTVSTPGQNPSRTFSGTAGQQVNVTITGNTVNGVYVEIVSPDGNVLTETYLTSASGFIDTVTLPSTGTYTLLVDPQGQATGKLTVKVSTTTGNNGTITIDGPAVTITATSGQNPTRTFSGTAGQQITLTFSGNTIAGGYINVLDPGSSDIGYVGLYNGASGFMDTITLPSSGTYTVQVDPDGTDTGQVTVAVHSLPANTGTITVGTATTITVGAAGQNPTRTFSGTAGQQITDLFTGNTLAGGYVNILDPGGSAIGYVGLYNGTSGFMDTITLPSTGTYTLQVDPDGQDTGHVTVKLGNVPANTGTITVGTATTITVGAAGQNPTRTFSGTAGQQITDLFTGNTLAGGYVNILDPGGSAIGYVGLYNGTSGFMDTITLPSTGTYTLQVDPDGQDTGHVTVKLGNVPANTGTITKGTATTITVTTAGQNPTRTFACSAGQSVSVSYTANTLGGGYVNLLDPSGGTFAYVGLYNGTTGTGEAGSVPSSGTCTLQVDPDGQDTGHVTVTLH